MNTATINSILLLVVVLPLGAGCKPDAEIGSPSAGNLESGPVVVLTDANFNREVLDSSQPVLVDFWAAWCSPCLELKPAIRELAEEYAGRLTIGQLNIEDNPFATAKYEIEAVPALLLFRDGELVERINGYQSRDELVPLVESALSAVRGRRLAAGPSGSRSQTTQSKE